MQYLLMIYQNEAEYGKIDPATAKEAGGGVRCLHQSIIQSGNFRAATGCRIRIPRLPVACAVTKTLTTDGPFAGTREQLAGYYLIEAKDLDAALSIAARIPSARYGSMRCGRSGSIIDG